MVKLPVVYRTNRTSIVNALEAEGVFDLLLKMIDESFPELDRQQMIVASLNLLKMAGQNQEGALLITKKKGLKIFARAKVVFADDEFIPMECDAATARIKKTNLATVKVQAKELEAASRLGLVAKVARIFSESLEVEDICVVSIDALYDMQENEEHMETMKFQTDNLHMHVLEALINFPDNKQLYCRGTMMLTALIKGEQLKAAMVGKGGGVMAACKALKNFNTANDLNVVRQSLWFLDEILQHDRNIYLFCHYKGPELYQKMLQLRDSLEDPGTVFLPKKLKALIKDRLPKFQEEYARESAAKQVELDRVALEEAKRRKARREALEAQVKKKGGSNAAEIASKSAKMKEMMQLEKDRKAGIKQKSPTATKKKKRKK
jgi:hypothetical protein